MLNQPSNLKLIMRLTPFRGMFNIMERIGF